MKLIYVCCLLFLVCCFAFAQIKYETKEEKLQQLKRRDEIKVTEIEKDILKLEYPNGQVLYKNIGDFKSQTTSHHQPTTYSSTYDTTVIDLTTIDTILYYHKYKFWQEVPIHNWDFDYLRIGDVNNNGKSELYGARKFFQSNFEPITAYELNDLGIFKPIYQYDSVTSARDIFDVDKDGNEEVGLTLPPLYDTVGNQQRFFSKENDTSLATKLNFTLTYNNGAQLNDIFLGNLDGDEFTDLLFSNSGYSDIHIFEYNPLLNNFDSVYRYDITDLPPEKGGFSVGDFDLDGKTEFVFSTIDGNVYVIENVYNNEYTKIWQGSVESYNAYIHTLTNDIDGNGKPEFWVLADGFFNGIGQTRITIFEADGDNSYQVVARVDLIGVFSFYAGNMQAVDIDNDGVAEVAICIDGNFLILKFNGNQNQHFYSTHYIKQNELNDEEGWQTYVGATMYNLQSTGEYGILISMYHSIVVQPSFYNTRYVTKIYKPDTTTSVNDDEIFPTSIKLHQNYPNPFNPITNIRFELNKSETVTIKVYNILGKEIKLLLEKNLPSGEYNIQWDGKDNKGNPLAGGIYFIQMIAIPNGRQAGKYQYIIKSVLLK